MGRCREANDVPIHVNEIHSDSWVRRERQGGEDSYSL